MCTVHRHVYRHMHRHVYRHMHRHVYRHVHRHAYRHVSRHVYRHVSRHVHRHVYSIQACADMRYIVEKKTIADTKKMKCCLYRRCRESQRGVQPTTKKRGAHARLALGLDGEESREGVEPLRHNFSSRLPSDNCNAELRPKLARYFF